jgi:ribulose kinase
MPYLLGIDGGTESLRAAVFDTSGQVLSNASAPYATAFPHPSWAEQNPADWWQVGVNARPRTTVLYRTPASRTLLSTTYIRHPL